MKGHAIFQVIPWMFHAILHFTLYHVVRGMSAWQKPLLYYLFCTLKWSCYIFLDVWMRDKIVSINVFLIFTLISSVMCSTAVFECVWAWQFIRFFIKYLVSVKCYKSYAYDLVLQGWWWLIADAAIGNGIICEIEVPKTSNPILCKERNLHIWI